MPNSMSVYHFLQVDFGEGYLLTYMLLVVTGGKQSQLLVLGLRLEFDINVFILQLISARDNICV